MTFMSKFTKLHSQLCFRFFKSKNKYPRQLSKRIVGCIFDSVTLDAALIVDTETMVYIPVLSSQKFKLFVY
jgi:hypothetical protein